MSDSDWDWYTTEAASLYTQYPVDSSQVNAGDFNEWAKEGLQLSEQYVYPGKCLIRNTLNQHYRLNFLECSELLKEH